MLRRIGCRVSWGRLISSKIFWSTSGYPRGQKHPLEIRAHRQRGGCPGTQTIKEKEEEEEDGAEGLHGAEMLIAVEGVGRKQSRPKHLEPRPPEHHTHPNATPPTTPHPHKHHAHPWRPHLPAPRRTRSVQGPWQKPTAPPWRLWDGNQSPRTREFGDFWEQ